MPLVVIWRGFTYGPTPPRVALRTPAPLPLGVSTASGAPMAAEPGKQAPAPAAIICCGAVVFLRREWTLPAVIGVGRSTGGGCVDVCRAEAVDRRRWRPEMVATSGMGLAYSSWGLRRSKRWRVGLFGRRWRGAGSSVVDIPSATTSFWCLVRTSTYYLYFGVCFAAGCPNIAQSWRMEMLLRRAQSIVVDVPGMFARRCCRGYSLVAQVFWECCFFVE